MILENLAITPLGRFLEGIIMMLTLFFVIRIWLEVKK